MERANVRVKGKWARPWLPQREPGRPCIICLTQRARLNEDGTSDLPEVGTPEFWKLIPDDLQGKFIIKSTYGGDAVTVAPENVHLTMRIYAALPALGYSVYTQTRHCVFIAPDDLPIDEQTGLPCKELTPELLECIHVKYMREYCQEDHLGMRTFFRMGSVSNPLLFRKESAWFSKEGKALVRDLIQASKEHKAWTFYNYDSDSEEEVIDFSQIRDGDIQVFPEVVVVPPRAGSSSTRKSKRSSLTSSSSSVDEHDVVKKPKLDPLPQQQQQEQSEDDLNLCVICMDAPATTVVHPCLCCVVCSACSRELKSTNDKNTCVRCRRQIERIDE